MQFINLMWEFIFIGFLSYGGGIGMISYIQKIAVQKEWLTLEQFSDMIALSQVTPGPIAINIATYVGYNVGGIIGAILATLALVTPSFLLVSLVIKFFCKYLQTDWMKSLLEGLRIVVLALIVSALVPLVNVAFITEGGIRWLGIIPLIYSIWASLNKKNILIVLTVTGLWGMIML